MIRYSHAMTCLMAYRNEKRTEAISIMLQAIQTYITYLKLHMTKYHIRLNMSLIETKCDYNMI
jgi:hypothetical protein